MEKYIRKIESLLENKQGEEILKKIEDYLEIKEKIDNEFNDYFTEVVHAKWEWYNEWKILRCSNCLESEGARENAKYCPNYGAKMDAENEDDVELIERLKIINPVLASEIKNKQEYDKVIEIAKGGAV